MWVYQSKMKCRPTHCSGVIPDGNILQASPGIDFEDRNPELVQI